MDRTMPSDAKERYQKLDREADKAFEAGDMERYEKLIAQRDAILNFYFD